MPYFTEPELKKLTLPSNKDYWVEVQPDLRWGDIKKFIGVSADGEVDASAGADIFLTTIIKSWNLDDADGKVLEITVDNVNRLDKEDAVFIINQTGGAVEDDRAKKNS